MNMFGELPNTLMGTDSDPKLTEKADRQDSISPNKDLEQMGQISGDK